jgi:hypothetical protein
MPNEITRRAPDVLTNVRQNNQDRRTSRALSNLENQTLLQIAQVQSRGLVAAEMSREVDHLTRDAMSGQALLRRWGDTLSAGDPFIADDMRFFTDIAKMGKGEIIANLIDDFCRRGR